MLLGGRSRITVAFIVLPRGFHITGAPSHLPQVDGQEVPQHSQVLCCLNVEPTGKDSTCKWSLKTISFLLYETKTVKRGSDYFKNNPCSCKKGEQSSQLWLKSAEGQEFIASCSSHLWDHEAHLCLLRRLCQVASGEVKMPAKFTSFF